MRTTKGIERCFVVTRRHNRPIVCLFNVASVDGTICAIFSGLNEDPERKI
ncbi:MAG TPA: hypothetical protein VFD30_04635 [Terriglobia bacterium]|nr:hypothetical protein [Terriglobia bacterium]